MHHLTLVLPFALPPAAHARDLIAQLRAPTLAKMLPRAASAKPKSRPNREQPAEHHAFGACLPHERWLAGHEADNSPALAHTLMQTMGLTMGLAAPAGQWFVVQPVHLHVALDHLVLTDNRQLNLGAAEARALFEAAEPMFAEQGQQLVYGNASVWFLHADRWSDLRTCTPDAACGHNIDIWQPSGGSARQWRRTHNEIQMLWHQHPVNEARDQQGLPRVNALWLWGGSDAASSGNGERLMAAQIAQPGKDPCHLPEQGGLRLIDALLPCALAEDWSGWLRQMAMLDDACFAPALAALAAGKLETISLVLSDNAQLTQWTLRRSSMRKFWVHSSLSRLSP